VRAAPAPAAGTCLEGYFPRSTDILILEHLPALSSSWGDMASSIESLFLRLQLHFNGSMPAIIILNMHRALQGTLDRPDIEMCIKAFMIEEDWCATNTTCQAAFKELPHPRSIIGPAEQISHNLARYHGFTSLSHTGLIHSLYRDDVHGRLNITECHMITKLFHDRVHPSDLGRLLMVSGFCWSTCRLRSCPGWSMMLVHLLYLIENICSAPGHAQMLHAV
jgi:hypothetical protein